MHIKQLIEYVNNPETLSNSSISDLSETIRKYPYFQTAHLLYLKNLYIQKGHKTDNELFKEPSNAHIANRRKLYNLLHHQEVSKADSASTEVKSDEDDKARDDGTDDQKTAKDLKILLDELPEDTRKYFLANPHFLENLKRKRGVLSKEETESEEEKRISDKKSPKQDLIDKFIEKAPTLERLKVKNTGDKSPENPKKTQGDNKKDDFVSDTLAKIYIKQGYYSRAINTYKKLSLKYPEKSSYFAEQIEMVNQLMKKNTTDE